MRTAISILLLGSTLVLAGCDASETDQAIDLLTDGAWRIVDPAANPDLPVRYEFRQNNRGGRLDLTFANGSELTTEWALDENATVLVYRDQGGEQINIPILTLTETDLRLEFDGTPVDFVRA
ncbi:MAG: hypothetical protein AAGI91_00075 [Bacteroidota bacterium]